MSKKQATDVLVVGAGPVGLALALELSRRGIECEVIDSASEIGHWWTRAMNMNKRTMEHMRRWGLAQRLKEINYVPAGWPGNVTLLDRLGGRQLACARADGLGWHRKLQDASEDALWIAQGQVQGVLLEAVRERGAAVSFSHRATALRLAGQHVEVDVQVASGATRTICARYVAGCDGGRSLVRQAAGIDTEGAGPLTRQVSMFFNAPTLLDDLRKRGVADSLMYLCADPAVPGTARLIAGDRWEYTYRAPQDVDESAIDGEGVIRELVGPGVPFRFERQYPFRYTEAVATRFQQDRIFIAGDAAHLIPPLGGHNLNLGFGDAVNLGWKLAHVLRGWADPAILESYTPERLPTVRRTAATAYANFERLRRTFERLADVIALEGDDEDTRRRREELSRDIALGLEPQWHSDGIVLDQRYDGSPILPADPQVPPAYDPARYQPCASPGHRAPMWRDPKGVPLYDRFGPEYTLLELTPARADGAALADCLASQGLPVTHLHVPETELRALYMAAYVLVRPDQHVAWRGDSMPADASALARELGGARDPAAAE